MKVNNKVALFVAICGLLSIPTGALAAARTTPLHKAAAAGDRAAVQRLLNSSAQVNATASNGWTPLHRAAQGGHELVARLLLDSGAQVNAASSGLTPFSAGLTPLHLATIKGHDQGKRTIKGCKNRI